MAQLLLIKNNKWKISGTNIGDVIAIREDGHKYDVNESTKFEVLGISGTMKQAKDAVKAKLPEIAEAYWDGEWVLIKEDTLTKDVTDEVVVVWKDGADYKRYENPPKYDSRYELNQFEENITASGNDTLITVSDRNP